MKLNHAAMHGECEKQKNDKEDNAIPTSAMN